MNTNTVVSLPAAEDLSGYDHVALTLGANGVSRAGTGDRIIGTLMRGNVHVEAGFVAGVTAVDVFLTGGNGFHVAPVGNDTTITRGDDLQGAAGGTLVKQTSGRAVAQALEGSGANPSGGIIRVIWIQDPAVVGQIPAQTSATVATANATDLASAEALANALKTAVNALVADVAALTAALQS